MPDVHPLRIESRRDETPLDRTFVLPIPPSLAETFRFEPGMFLTVSDPEDDVRPPRRRAYSISSSPTDAGRIELTVRREGAFGVRFHAFEPGKVLDVIPPRGRFVLAPGDDDLLLLAAGSGVTPFRSFFRFLAATRSRRRATLVLTAKVPDELLFDGELRALTAGHPSLRYVPTVTRLDPSLPFDGRRGRIDAAVVRAHVLDPARTFAYACGPAPFVEAMLGLAAEAGVPADRRRKEAWG